MNFQKWELFSGSLGILMVAELSVINICLSGSRCKHLSPFNRSSLSSKTSLERNSCSVESNKLLKAMGEAMTLQ